MRAIVRRHVRRGAGFRVEAGEGPAGCGGRVSARPRPSGASGPWPAASSRQSGRSSWTSAHGIRAPSGAGACSAGTYASPSSPVPVSQHAASRSRTCRSPGLRPRRPTFHAHSAPEKTLMVAVVRLKCQTGAVSFSQHVRSDIDADEARISQKKRSVLDPRAPCATVPSLGFGRSDRCRLVPPWAASPRFPHLWKTLWKT